jgi:hypothetical protein
VYKNINDILQESVPIGIVRTLKCLCFNTSAQNLHFFSYLVNITDLFHKNDITVIPFKGPILSQELYGDLGMRPFSDLDIIVGKTDAVSAWQLLLDNGFEPALDLNIRQRQKYIKSTKHAAFLKDRVSLELHWSMTGYLNSPLTIDHVKNDLKNVMTHNREMPTLCREKLLVYLCVHGASHGWMNLELVCSVAEILKDEDSLDWSLVNTLAAKWQCQRMLYLGLDLAWKLLEAPLPQVILDKVQADKQISGFTLEVVDFMFTKGSEMKTKNLSDKFSSFHIRIRDSFTDKLRYICRLAFCATVKDWAEYPVVASLSFLHFFLRPSRLVQEGVKKQITAR